MPSALTGNTSGLASATSPGLVGITTQTFAGDKTLTGLTTASGGIINSGLTGANATTVTTSGSGKVGELISTNLSSIFQITPPTVSTYYDVTSSTLILPAGNWLVSLYATVQVTTNATVGTSGLYVAIRTGSTVISSVIACNAPASSNFYANASMCFSTMTSGVTLKLSIQVQSLSGFFNCTEILMRNDLAPSLFRACRIA